MLTNNFQISGQQLKKMLVFDLLSISILIIPYLAASGAGRDGLFAILIAAALAVVYGWFMLYVCTLIKQDYLLYCRHTLGNILSFLFGLFYLVKFMFAAVFVLALFTNVIHETILPNTGRQIILGTLILLSVFYASKTMEVRARMVELLYFIVLVPLFLLFFLGLFRVNPANLLPLATGSMSALPQTSYTVFLTYSAMEFILFAAPSVSGETLAAGIPSVSGEPLAPREPSASVEPSAPGELSAPREPSAPGEPSQSRDEDRRKFQSKLLQGIFVTTLFNGIVFIIVAGLLGITGAAAKPWSTISVMQMIEFPGGFVHRQDALMLSFWLASIFTVTSSLFHYLCRVTTAITGTKKRWPILLFYAVLLFALTMRPIHLDTLFQSFGSYMAYVGVPQSMILPLLLILVGKIKKGVKQWAQ